MKRQLLLIGIAFMFLLSGWGSALGAALCLHGERVAVEQVDVPEAEEAPSCCSAAGAAESNHCPMSKKSAAHHSGVAHATAEHEEAETAAADHSRTTPPPAPLDRAAVDCFSCATCSVVPRGPEDARQTNVAQRDYDAPAPRTQAVATPSQFSFAAVRALSRGAPPLVGHKRRHALISVFLI